MMYRNFKLPTNFHRPDRNPWGHPNLKEGGVASSQKKHGKSSPPKSSKSWQHDTKNIENRKNTKTGSTTEEQQRRSATGRISKRSDASKSSTRQLARSYRWWRVFKRCCRITLDCVEDGYKSAVKSSPAWEEMAFTGRSTSILCRRGQSCAADP